MQESGNKTSEMRRRYYGPLARADHEVHWREKESILALECRRLTSSVLQVHDEHGRCEWRQKFNRLVPCTVRVSNVKLRELFPGRLGRNGSESSNCGLFRWRMGCRREWLLERVNVVENGCRGE